MVLIKAHSLHYTPDSRAITLKISGSTLCRRSILGLGERLILLYFKDSSPAAPATDGEEAIVSEDPNVVLAPSEVPASEDVPPSEVLPDASQILEMLPSTDEAMVAQPPAEPMTDETPRHIPSSVPEPATASGDRAEEDSAPLAVHLPEESTVIPSLLPSVPLSI